MAWCKLEDTFRDHWKLKRLATELKTSRAEARGLVCALWSWAVGHAPDGDLSQLDVTEIEEAADWEGPPGEFVRAVTLERVGIIETTSNGYVLHDFLERAESHKSAQKKAKQRERQRRHRVQKNMSPDSPGTVHTMLENVSPRRGEERRGEERRREDINTVPGAKPASVTLPSTGSPSALPVVEKTPVSKIRSTWLAENAKAKPNSPPYPWGAKENGQAAALLRSWPLAELLELIPKFFEWKNQRVIEANRPFGTGPNSFVLKVHELAGDVHEASRRAVAAQVGAGQRLNDRAAVTDGVVEQAKRILRQKGGDDEN